MLPLFSKQLEAVGLDDINQLISEGFPEGSTVEYKESLPHSKGGQDPWFTGDPKIRDYARNMILKEVVAFANSHGGHVLIGIKESTEKPPRAEGISPIPRCAELAEKLRLMARDSIEPQLPVVMTWGVEVDPGGAGVVIIRVPQSRAAPHRLIPTKECYYRRNDRSEKMTMREIQDLTLNRERGLSLVNARFDERREAFRRRLEKIMVTTTESTSNRDLHAIRVTLIPISSDLWIEDVFRNSALRPLFETYDARLGRHEQKISIDSSFNPMPRPILGGVRYESSKRLLTLSQELLRDGLVEFSFIRTITPDWGDTMYPEWVCNLACNAMLTAHKFRTQAGAPATEYGLEVEVLRTAGDLKISDFPQSDLMSFEGSAEANPLHIPRLSLGPPEEFQKVMAILFRDLMNAAGFDPEDDFEITIPEALVSP